MAIDSLIGAASVLAAAGIAGGVGSIGPGTGQGIARYINNLVDNIKKTIEEPFKDQIVYLNIWVCFCVSSLVVIFNHTFLLYTIYKAPLLVLQGQNQTGRVAILDRSRAPVSFSTAPRRSVEATTPSVPNLRQDNEISLVEEISDILSNKVGKKIVKVIKPVYDKVTAFLNQFKQIGSRSRGGSPSNSFVGRGYRGGSPSNSFLGIGSQHTVVSTPGFNHGFERVNYKRILVPTNAIPGAGDPSDPSKGLAIILSNYVDEVDDISINDVTVFTQETSNHLFEEKKFSTSFKEVLALDGTPYTAVVVNKNGKVSRLSHELMGLPVFRTENGLKNINTDTYYGTLMEGNGGIDISLRFDINTSYDQTVEKMVPIINSKFEYFLSEFILKNIQELENLVGHGPYLFSSTDTQSITLCKAIVNKLLSSQDSTMQTFKTTLQTQSFSPESVQDVVDLIPILTKEKLFTIDTRYIERGHIAPSRTMDIYNGLYSDSIVMMGDSISNGPSGFDSREANECSSKGINSVNHKNWNCVKKGHSKAQLKVEELYQKGNLKSETRNVLLLKLNVDMHGFNYFALRCMSTNHLILKHIINPLREQGVSPELIVRVKDKLGLVFEKAARLGIGHNILRDSLKKASQSLNTLPLVTKNNTVSLGGETLFSTNPLVVNPIMKRWALDLSDTIKQVNNEIIMIKLQNKQISTLAYLYGVTVGLDKKDLTDFVHLASKIGYGLGDISAIKGPHEKFLRAIYDMGKISKNSRSGNEHFLESITTELYTRETFALAQMTNISTQGGQVDTVLKEQYKFYQDQNQIYTKALKELELLNKEINAYGTKKKTKESIEVLHGLKSNRFQTFPLMTVLNKTDLEKFEKFKTATIGNQYLYSLDQSCENYIKNGVSKTSII